MMMVKFSRSSSISSSIFAVAIGSSAEQGSSMRMTSGPTAMARAMHRRCCWPPDNPVPVSSSRSLTSSNRPARLQAGHHDLVEIGFRFREAMDARAIGDVLVDRLRKRVRLLEHHADAGAQLHHVESGIIDVLSVDLDSAGHARDRDGVVHPVDAAQERRLAAPRWADQRGHRPLRDIEVDIEQCALLAVIDVDAARHDFGGALDHGRTDRRPPYRAEPSCS